MKVIVTGAASFIGSAVVRKLLDSGNEVCAVVRPGSESTKEFEKMLSREYPDALEARMTGPADDVTASKVQTVELDLQDIERLPDILNVALIDTVSSELYPFNAYAHTSSSRKDDEDEISWDVFLHAGWEGAGSANREKEDVQQLNVAYTIAALHTAAKLGCKRFLFTGSQAEYGIVSRPATEDTPTDPVSPYGKAKVAVSREAVPLSKKLGIEYVHVRLYSIYGPGDHKWSLVNSCLREWKKGETVKLGPCKQRWNFLYVTDVASALYTLLTEGQPGFYNIAGEDTRPLCDYIKEMARICGAEGLYTFGDRPQNAEGAADLIPDISKIEEDTSWRPKTSFKEGISQMWEMED